MKHSSRHDSPKAEKTRLRAEALLRRDALPADLRIEKSLAIAEHGEREIALPADAVVSGFWPIRTEVDVRPLLAATRERGARLCLPVVLDRETIVFRELVRGAKMVATGFETYGPGPEAEVLDPTLMLMPLAAFDADGNRIGYGAGFYDRAVARLHAKGIDPQLIGVAFDCQEVEAVPAEPHDIRLHAIMTESGLRRFGRSL